MVADPIEELARSICQHHGYTFVRSCDAGAFKKTYQVKEAGADLALKLVVGPIDPLRIQREIEALRACNHPNISRLLHVDVFDNQSHPIVYFVEEFFSGGTLASAHAAGKTFSLGEVQSLAVHLAEAVAHLAARHIVHRDIKPENIMYRGDGTPVLLDLGIARHLDASTLTQPWAMRGPGTPVYAAPEQLLNDKHSIDWRTDQFSLGITLSVACLGMHPYSGNTTFDNVIDRMSRREKPQAVFAQTAQSSGLDVLVKMVEPWPVKRFTRPEQLIAAWQQMRLRT